MRVEQNHNPAKAFLAMEALAEIVASAWQIRFLSFRRISERLAPNEESPRIVEQGAEREIRRVAWALSAAVRRMPRGATCLATALAGGRMLARRGVSSTLYLGLTREPAAGQPLGAHAWLRSGPVIVAGATSKERYATVARFLVSPRMNSPHATARPAGEPAAEPRQDNPPEARSKREASRPS